MKIEHLKSDAILDCQTGINFARLSAFSATTRMHDHDFAELFLVNRGEIIHKVNGKGEFVSKGDLVFIRPEDTHCFSNAGTECELYNIAFKKELLEKCVNFLGNGISLSGFYVPEYPPILKLNDFERMRFVDEIASGGEKLLSEPMISKIKFHILVLTFFSLRFAESSKRDSDMTIPLWLNELCDKMRLKNNFTKGLRRMQEMAYCSPEHLCRCCKSYFGKSPTELINELRVNYAASELLHSDEKIFTIAINSGFSNLSHFYHQFKKIHHVSPAVYRKNQQHNLIP